MLPNPFKLKPPKISQIIFKKANPVREVIDDARELIRSGRDEIAGVASALRVEGQVAPPKPAEEGAETETKQNEEEGATASLSDLKGFLEKRKVEKALSQLEKDEGDKKENLETVRKYIEGEDLE